MSNYYFLIRYHLYLVLVNVESIINYKICDLQFSDCPKIWRVNAKTVEPPKF